VLRERVDDELEHVHVIQVDEAIGVAAHAHARAGDAPHAGSGIRGGATSPNRTGPR